MYNRVIEKRGNKMSTFETILIPIIIILELIIIFIIANSKKKDPNLRFIEKSLERIEMVVKDEISKNRSEATQNGKLLREENFNNLNSMNDAILSRISAMASMEKNQMEVFSKQLSTMTEINERKLDKLTEVMEEKMKNLQQDNSKKLEEIRFTVDEKLHSALEKRLGESFKLVSDRLELVHKGLGEMQNLASGVGDLKKVLTNVKVRGSWGEIQLGTLLDQILIKEQYDMNVITKKNGTERVEFAVKLPSKDSDDNSVWLPIDSKFPLEDYQRLIKAQEDGDKLQMEACIKQLEIRILSEAKDIKDKYIDPPSTTDFGILFIPIEGLYCEVLRIPGLSDKLQQQFRVVITGPTTLAALLNSLQMGFRSLAIEKRSSEVWQLLATVKTEFVRFGDILDKTQKKLQEASNTMELASQKSRTIQRKLKDVQSIPNSEIVKEINPHEDEDLE